MGFISTFKRTFYPCTYYGLHIVGNLHFMSCSCTGEVFILLGNVQVSFFNPFIAKAANFSRDILISVYCLLFILRNHQEDSCVIIFKCCNVWFHESTKKKKKMLRKMIFSHLVYHEKHKRKPNKIKIN